MRTNELITALFKELELSNLDMNIFAKYTTGERLIFHTKFQDSYYISTYHQSTIWELKCILMYYKSNFLVVICKLFPSGLIHTIKKNWPIETKI